MSRSIEMIQNTREVNIYKRKWLYLNRVKLWEKKYSSKSKKQQTIYHSKLQFIIIFPPACQASKQLCFFFFSLFSRYFLLPFTFCRFFFCLFLYSFSLLYEWNVFVAQIINTTTNVPLKTVTHHYFTSHHHLTGKF